MCQAKRNGGSLVDREQALEAWGRGEQPPGEKGERGKGMIFSEKMSLAIQDFLQTDP